MLPRKPVFHPHALKRMDQYAISEIEVLMILDRGVRSPAVADAGAAPRFSYLGVIEGRRIEAIVAMEESTMLVVTVILRRQ
jgi:hypothetical protein